MIAVIIIVVLLLVLVAANIKIVPQAHSYVVERLGAYKETWDVGLHIKVPFIDRVARQVDLKEQYCDFPPQPVITQDNVTMQI
ncbi:MAG: peptidase, partial [Butyrivibrio sp.]|nr:peptidase [Butyrivibrio sp.]